LGGLGVIVSEFGESEGVFISLGIVHAGGDSSVLVQLEGAKSEPFSSFGGRWGAPRVCLKQNPDYHRRPAAMRGR
jgi:hypothetical protein